MHRFLISFDDGSMNHLDADDLQAASIESHAVVADAKRAGVWIFGGGILHQRASVAQVDGTIVDGPDPASKVALGGLVIIECETRDEAHDWAARFAAACRCAQEVREIAYDPES
jgi:hypothetical protein